MLIGQEQHFFTLSKSPLQTLFCITRSADRATVASGKGLDRSGGVHVRDRHCDIGDSGRFEYVPAGFDLIDGCHICHRAAGSHVRKDNLLIVCRQDVCALGHEVHSAKYDVFGVGVRGGLLSQFERVAGDIGKGNDFVALVMVTQDEHSFAEPGFCRQGSSHQTRI
ncbi:unannotated protein [freshwater metagenome]|uniref:Unannotated protein n=1 Tax=freshwater metagenome TaxID=449393 RepID=A0A6J7SK52_9ZZZZ